MTAHTEPTRLQVALADAIDAVDRLEALAARERVVGLDVIRRRVRRLLRRHAAIAAEWCIDVGNEPASISIEFSLGRARLRTRGSDRDLRELAAWLARSDEAFSDFQTCIEAIR